MRVEGGHALESALGAVASQGPFLNAAKPQGPFLSFFGGSGGLIDYKKNFFMFN